MSETPGGPPRGDWSKATPALASSTATRRSISPRTWSSFSSSEPSLRSAATDFSRNSIAWSREPPSRPSLSLSSASSARLPCLDRAAAPLDRILDPLQGDQGIDAAERAQHDRRAGRLRRVGFGKGEAATSAAPPPTRVRSDSGPIRSADAHASTLRLHGQWVVKCHRGRARIAAIAGKICRAPGRRGPTRRAGPAPCDAKSAVLYRAPA